MNILDLLQADGILLKRVASTGGGEYAGPCPFCKEGKDRLRVWPNKGNGGSYWCRQCDCRGDDIQYLRDYRGMSFRDACQYAGRELTSPTPSLSSKRTAPIREAPRQTEPPNAPWQERARMLVEEMEIWLFQSSTFAQRMLGWLKERRGLSEETIRAHRLGLVPIDRWEAHTQWEIEPVFKDDGTPKKIWIPRGLTIPLCQDGKILRIRIRRLKSDGDPRYYLLRGSDSRAMVLGKDRDVLVVVESELDAILLFQEAGDLVGVIALGNAQARPDKEAKEALGNCKLILLALDADAAGAKEAWRWWPHHFSNARRWPPVTAKDPGEMLQHGTDLRAWVEAGIENYLGEVAKSGKKENEQSSSGIAHNVEPNPQAPPFINEAVRGQESQAQIITLESLLDVVI